MHHQGLWKLSFGVGLILLTVLSMLGMLPSEQAAAQPPRPTLTPTIAVHPTSRPARGSGNAVATPVPGGRITGTVIDQSTGAPAPHVAVEVGDIAVQTDANGNYDRQELPPGRYRVALASGQGTPAQEPIEIDLAAGATVVQHLYFSSLSVVTTQISNSQPEAISQPPKRLPETGNSPAQEILLLLVMAGVCFSTAWLVRTIQRTR